MTQRTFDAAGATLHVAIIMDGNGRWAAARGQPRAMGHAAGSRAVRRAVEAATRDPAIGTLTLYAFSGDNWRRPAAEVHGLMRLFARYLRREAPRCVAAGVRLTILGRRDRLPAELRDAIERAEDDTRTGAGLHLRIAVDYSGRDAIVRAAVAMSGGAAPGDEADVRRRFAQLLGEVDHDRDGAPDVDLLIRTGGEHRLSDFLLWECSYAELVFTPRLWPDFSAADLSGALAEFGRRERRFGGLPDTRATA